MEKIKGLRNKPSEKAEDEDRINWDNYFNRNNGP